MKLPLFKKADILLIALCLALGAASLLFAGRGQKDGSTAVVSVDGKTVASYSLSEDGSYDIQTPYGVNRIVVEDGSVRVDEADCRGRDCVRLGRISRAGQIIVCLPHHLTISIGGEDAPDVVIR